MTSVFWSFFYLCLLKLGPQDLPASRFLLCVSLGAYAAISLVFALFLVAPATAVALTMVDVALLAGLTALLLWIRNLGARLLQTLTALAGVGAMFGLLNAILMAWHISLQPGPQETTVPSFLSLCGLAWNVLVIGHILRHALSTVLIGGVLLAVLYVYISVRVLQGLFGPLG